MNKITGLALLSALFLTGCATGVERIESLESRLDALERKCSMTSSKETMKISETAAVAETKISKNKEIVIPDSPTKSDIQISLKNAGFYTGEVDGKFGPRTKKAIENFQEANELKIDGKVGPNTWDKLKEYYTPPETK